MKKKFLVTFFSLIGIICVLYYTIKFYYQGGLSFEQGVQCGWTLMSILITSCLGVSIFNSFKIDSVFKQNKELISTNNKLEKVVMEMSEKLDKNQFEVLHTLQNNDENVLDLSNSLEEVAKKGG